MKKIPLSQGLFAQVDDRDYDVLMSIGPWHARKGRHTYYAVTHITMNGKRAVRLAMHAVLLGTRGKRTVVDHVDGDGLNNRRDNLRRATISQNNMNKRKQRNGKTSRFVGVSTHNRRPGRFRATIHGDGKHIELGFFSTEEEAARAYDRAALKYFGEFARLNFPEVCHF